MSNSMPWFRFYSEAFHDAKIVRICLKTKLPKYAVLGAITSLLCIANDSPVRGKLMMSENEPMGLDEIFYMCGIGEEGERLVKALLESGVLSLEGETYLFTNWEKRQHATSEATERVRRFREKKKQEKPVTPDNSNVTVTLLKQDGNTTETADSDYRLQITESPLTPQNGGDGEGEKKVIDPIEHALSYEGKSTPQAVEPDVEFEHFFGKYRDEILQAYQGTFEVPLNQGRRDKLLELARMKNFRIDLFKEYLNDYNVYGGNPYEVGKLVDSYPIYLRTGDIYSALSGKRSGNGSGSGEEWVIVDPETGKELAEW